VPVWFLSFNVQKASIRAYYQAAIPPCFKQQTQILSTAEYEYLRKQKQTVMFGLSYMSCRKGKWMKFWDY
jgi:hypothetical protein